MTFGLKYKTEPYTYDAQLTLPFDTNPLHYFWQQDKSQSLAQYTEMFFVNPTTMRVVYRIIATNDNNIMDGHDPLSFDNYQTRMFVYQETGLTYTSADLRVAECSV